MSTATGDPASEMLPEPQPTVLPTTTETTTPTTVPPLGQEPMDEDDIFDKDRAMVTIRRLRDEAKGATRAIKELETLRAEKAERDHAAMSASEQRDARLKQLEAEVEFEREEKRDRVNALSVQLQASRLGIVDPEAAVKLLDWSSIEYDADGAPLEVDKALRALVKTRPWLAGQPVTPTMNTGNGATRVTAPGQRTYTQTEIRDWTFYENHRADIVRAMQEGRIVSD